MNPRRSTSNVRERSHRVRRVSLILVVVAVGIGLAFGIRNVSPLSPATGTLTGTFQAVGGPPGIVPRELSGTITAKTAGQGILGFPVTDGRFTVDSVVVGSYTVTGKSPQFDGGRTICHATRRVTVTKGATSNVKIDCQER
jgi:hypothetical protein